MNNTITCEVTKSVSVLIKSTVEDVDLQEPLYAINWFSTKMEWLYHLYNLLASRSVTKIGGKPFFKGKICEIIVDDVGVHRDLLLIVNYPGGGAFKALMESTYFKIVSLLRVLAVKDFTFGFTQMRAVDSFNKSADLSHYLVHHFKSKDSNVDSASLLILSVPSDVRIKYAGEMVANLYSQRKSKNPEVVPNLMDGIVVFESASKDSLLSMIQSADYRRCLSELSSSYIAFIHRIF